MIIQETQMPEYLDANAMSTTNFIEKSLDVLNQVQSDIAEIEHSGLKREFDNRMLFHSGINLQHMLPFGKIKVVHSEVIKIMRVLISGVD
jgi:uroporphyrinogen decarboxylase